MCPIRQHRVGLPESTIDLVPTFWVPEILATKGNEPQLRFHRVDICRFDLFRIWPEVLRTDNGVYFCFPSSCLYLLVRQPESKFANVIKGWFLGHYRYPNRMRVHNGVYYMFAFLMSLLASSGTGGKFADLIQR